MIQKKKNKVKTELSVINQRQGADLKVRQSSTKESVLSYIMLLPHRSASEPITNHRCFIDANLEMRQSKAIYGGEHIMLYKDAGFQKYTTTVESILTSAI